MKQQRIPTFSKRALSLFLVILTIAAMIPAYAVESSAITTKTLAELQAMYPAGKYWNHAGKPGSSNSVNNPGGYTSTPCSQHGVVGTSKQTCNGFTAGGSVQLSWQCMGFAEQLGYLATGFNPRLNANGWTTIKNSSALNNLKRGDIIRYKNNGHSIYVTGVNGDTITYADCNSDGHCKIRWGATISKSTVRSTFSYVRSAPSQVPPGPSCSCSTSYAGSYLCTTSSLNLTIRSGHGSSYSAVGSIPPGATVTVTKADGSWAHVEYNGKSGYASMEYLKKKQVHANTPSIRWWLSETEYGSNSASFIQGKRYYLCYELYDSVTGKPWDEVSKNSYKVTMAYYYPDGSLMYNYTSSRDDSWISCFFEKTGTYKAVVSIEGDFLYKSEKSFTVNANPLRGQVDQTNVNLTLGEKESQAVIFTYGGYYDGNWVVSWSTSNDNVGAAWGDWENSRLPLTITAKKRGTTDITITMKDKTSGTALHKLVVRVTVNAKTYSVSFNGNGGSSVPSAVTKYHGSTLTLPTAIPVRAGYTFKGWATSSGGSVTYRPGASYTSNSGAVLYAVWEKGCENGAHSYSTKVTSPTCTERGYTDYQCRNCGYSYRGSYVDAKGHSYTSKVTAPTCTADGYTTYTCSCGHSYKGSYVSAKGHSYTYKVSKAPTEGAVGSLLGSCSCGSTKSVTLPKLNTTDYSYLVIKEATQDAEGVGRYTWRNTTYGKITVDVTIAKKPVSHEHKFMFKGILAMPTVTSEGMMAAECACGEIVLIYLPKLDFSAYDFVMTRPTSSKGVYTYTDRSYGVVAAFEAEAASGVSPVTIGDINGDGILSVTDVTALLRFLSGDRKSVSGITDVDGNGSTTISDVTCLLELISGKQ